MGSSGSGSLTDYSKRKPVGNNNGGASGEDNCNKAFSTSLEEVSRCDYFLKHKTVPFPGTQVLLFFKGMRLTVETTKGEEVGYLPTKFNYLRACIAGGLNYAGTVSASSSSPFPNVTVDIVPV